MDHHSITPVPARGDKAGPDTSALSASHNPQLRRRATNPHGDPPVRASIGWFERHHAAAKNKKTVDQRLRSMPPVDRVSMVPSEIDRRPLRRLWRKLFARQTAATQRRIPAALSEPAPLRVKSFHTAWRKSATRRRIILALLVSVQTAIASWSLARTFPTTDLSGLEIIIVANFAILFSWISFSFLTTVAGFWTLWRNSSTIKLAAAAGEDAQPPLRSRTAVVMPICNEEVSRCFAGIAAIYQSCGDTGALDKFDFFVLSDTGDAARQLEEEHAWEQTCRALNGFGKIYYRHRRNNIKRKSGNIADFLRRWSKRYDYMIVLDADSLMSGELIVRLARMMDHSPEVGIIQTAPTIVNRESLFARVQQFASRVYGPLFSASLHFWQLGESYYWGHNAIIRIAPFVEHCGLARLPGEPPLGGEILSHDFVEAALMGRAGWEVWLAHDLVGSYEESPPNILDELKRDRRWCQGNLQHLRLLFGEGIRFGHRAIMAMGIMAYVSALLWATFLLLSSAEVIVQSVTPTIYFSHQPSLFPNWPIWHPELALALLTTTGILLVLPKFLSFALFLKNRQTADFGGTLRLTVGILLEIAYSTLMAPLRMWFHSKFVLLTLLGRQIKWSAQRRNDSETSWSDAVRRHGFSTFFALAWMSAALYWNAALAWWLAPVSAALILAIPLSVYSSRVSWGRAMQRWRICSIPEENAPPPVVQCLKKLVHQDSRKGHYLNRSITGWVLSPRDRLPGSN
jgi:membrane glycosyltransferase